MVLAVSCSEHTDEMHFVPSVEEDFAEHVKEHSETAVENHSE